MHVSTNTFIGRSYINDYCEILLIYAFGISCMYRSKSDSISLVFGHHTGDFGEFYFGVDSIGLRRLLQNKIGIFVKY